jgi:hypothetical protein
MPPWRGVVVLAGEVIDRADARQAVEVGEGALDDLVEAGRRSGRRCDRDPAAEQIDG